MDSSSWMHDAFDAFDGRDDAKQREAAHEEGADLTAHEFRGEVQVQRERERESRAVWLVSGELGRNLVSWKVLRRAHA